MFINSDYFLFKDEVLYLVSVYSFIELHRLQNGLQFKSLAISCEIGL